MMMSLSQRISALIFGAALLVSNTIQEAQNQQDQIDSAHRKSTEFNIQDDSTSNATNRTINSGLAGYLLADSTDRKLNQSNRVDSLISDLLNRVGPDMRPMRDFRDYDDITPEAVRRAWLLMHDHAQKAMVDRMQFIKPIISEILIEAQVTSLCSKAALDTIEAAKQMDLWAVQLLTSWGNFPPIGFYEGTFGDIGSYHGCVNVPQNPIIKHAHYCTVSYRPIMSYRPDYELIVRQEPTNLLSIFNRNNNSANSSSEDAFTELLSAAQYHHYVYYKLGTCFPIDCSPFDVQKLARLVGKQSILMSGPVKCHSKYSEDYRYHPNGNTIELEISTRDINKGVYIWKPHITNTQLVSAFVVFFITFIILAITMIDLTVNYIIPSYNLILRTTGKKSNLNSISLKRTNGTTSENNQADTNNNNLIDSASEANWSIDIERTEVVNRFIDDSNDCRQTPEAQVESKHSDEQRSLFNIITEDFSILTNVRDYFHISEGQMKNEIRCINGIRCITMSWIITTHTMQYNDWSAFARIRQVETLLQSLINQPLFNGSYLVDTFFLVSGLLTSYSTFRKCTRVPEKVDSGMKDRRYPSSERRQEERTGLTLNFSPVSYLIGRYLRLTPQIIFVSLLFILLPLLTQSGGPHWYTITGEYSENCSQNWWINLFHIQAFYQSKEMCNFVSWWISVDMFYHLLALAVILLILRYGHKSALLSCAILTLAHGTIQAKKHYQLELPPNLLSTIPQTGAMWSQMTLEFFWTPYAHALPYFLGFYLGYLMARNAPQLSAWFSLKRALLGWTVALLSLILQSYSTYFWVVGRWRYTPIQSTIFHLSSAAIWSICLGWIILACQFGYGGLINRMLSCKFFMVLGRASYIVYLSHFLVLFTFFGSQNLLLEPTTLMMLYVIIGNVCLAMLLGSFLCIAYEMPWLKTQRRIMKYIR